jgi:hypothetical protein
VLAFNALALIIIEFFALLLLLPRLELRKSRFREIELRKSRFREMT